ncbi:hypothetical protein Plhal304r1_c042g0121371 [Plasmopara halstedii]
MQRHRGYGDQIRVWCCRRMTWCPTLSSDLALRSRVTIADTLWCTRQAAIPSMQDVASVKIESNKHERQKRQ